ncbi:hypothetical protein IFM89_036669 [Coptis chinensis]|uniref:DYW domain-containing protein n=1 Tax=Coptis chinensis TaxID=261450 RepID=A0A835I6Y7_9MAGN|nr:hypothetical protein IFM89_036669 [Coptis chinensis]
MASLPSVAVTGVTQKLDLEYRKFSQHYSISTDKNTNISYQRSYTSKPSEKNIDPKSLDYREALSILKESSVVESAVYVPILQECIDNYSVSEAQMIHTHVIKTGYHEDMFLMTFLINVYTKCGAMDFARGVFDKLSKKNVVTWTALITGYVRNSEPELAIRVFLELLESGAYPTNYTLGAVVSACSSLYLVGMGKQIHGYIVKYNIESDTSTGNAICSLYSKCRRFDLAVKAFRRIPEKNVISWTTMISACGDNGDAMLGLKIFVEMLLDGVEPNEFTLTSVLSLCCVMQALEFGEQVHSLSIKFGCVSNLPVKNSIMYLYLRSGKTDEAQKLFSAMETISLVTWNAMIAGYAQMMENEKNVLKAQHSGTDALNIFLKLNRSSLKPDLFTFSSILTVCSSLVAIEQGEQIHAQTIKTGFLSDIVVGSALVNMYNKCGSIEKATRAFVEMPTRTLISWTSMITGYAQHGRSAQALQLFEDMRLAGERPNKITFVGVFSACSHAGMVDQAMRYFKMMKKEYRIKPVVDHFACLVDMFVRLGRLQDAFDFIEKMEFEPNEFIWSILIAGCRSHGNMDLGFYAAERLLELKPKDFETYVLLLSMYLSAGRWKDVSKVRKLMKDENLGKVTDWSSISIKDKVHSFRPDDRSQSHSTEIYKLLDNLLDKAKSLGYASLKSLEMADEEETDKTFSSAIHHSEKLAVAFGLLNMTSGASVRVLKSSSMCRDCHSLIMYISVLTGREIVIRDSKRLHQFNNGHCSCGDFGSLL